jgi:hypothetical protein
VASPISNNAEAQEDEKDHSNNDAKNNENSACPSLGPRRHCWRLSPHRLTSRYLSSIGKIASVFESDPTHSIRSGSKFEPLLFDDELTMRKRAIFAK